MHALLSKLYYLLYTMQVTFLDSQVESLSECGSTKFNVMESPNSTVIVLKSS